MRYKQYVNIIYTVYIILYTFIIIQSFNNLFVVSTDGEELRSYLNGKNYEQHEYVIRTTPQKMVQNTPQ